MRKRYVELNNLWCHKESAVSSIMNYLKEAEPSCYLDIEFKEGWVVTNNDGSYSVSMLFTADDENTKDSTSIHLQVCSSIDNEISAVVKN